MSLLLACIYVITCCVLIRRMVTKKGLTAVQLGVLGLFSLGYYPLPVLFKPLSTLADIDDEKIFYALLIHWLFLLCIISGAALAGRVTGATVPLSFGGLDSLAYRHRYAIAFIAFALYLGYVATTAQTSYATEDFDAFFEEKSPVRSILAAVAGLCVGFIGASYAAASASNDRRSRIVYGGMIATIVLLAIPLGQRLALISPIVVLFAMMAASRQTAKAMRVLAVAAVVLAIMSPFAVYMRQARRTANGDFLSASEVVGRYQIADNPFMQSFESLINRSDLVHNTVYMKDFIDSTEYVGWDYYYSVLVSPIPRFAYPDKPFVLSSNGRIDGEISTLSWRVMIGGLGSLTAFGGLTAYREGGWLAVILDGLAAGAFFAWIARWLGQGGIIARVFYANYFLIFFVQKAPCDFFEALASFLGIAPLILILYVFSRSSLFVKEKVATGLAAESRP